MWKRLLHLSYSLAHLFMAVNYGSTVTPASVILVVQSWGLVYDNLVLFLTQNLPIAASKPLNAGRFWLHAVATPLLLVGMYQTSWEAKMVQAWRCMANS